MVKITEEKTERIPHLRILPISSCDFNCIFCRNGGEGYADNPSLLMTTNEIVDIARTSSSWFKALKFSGGEPLNRPDILEMVAGVHDIKKFKEITLITRGLKLEQYAATLRDAGLNSVTVSLDAANRELFKEFTGKDAFDITIRGMRASVACGLRVTINSVITQRNLGEIPALIELAAQIGARLKLIDLMDEDENPQFWMEEFIPFNDERVAGYLTRRAKSIDVELPPGGLGTPMARYVLDNDVEVLTRDATVGTNYGQPCLGCKYFPCQDALISLRITHDGHLKTCLMRNDNLVDILTPLRRNDFDTVCHHIEAAFLTLKNAKFRPHGWSPKLQKELYQRLSMVPKFCGLIPGSKTSY